MRITCYIALLLMSMAGTTMAQQTDSHLIKPGNRGRFDGLSHIEVDLGQKNALIVGFTRYSQIEPRKNIDSVLRLFVANYQRIIDTTQSPIMATHALLRLGETNQTIELRSTPQPSTSFRFAGDRVTPVLVKTKQDTLQVVWSSAVDKQAYYDFSVYLMINSLNDIEPLLKNGGVNGLFLDALKAVGNYKGHDLTDPKMSFDLWYERKGKEERSLFFNPGLAKGSFISFQPGFGVGLIRSQWVPSLNIDAHFIPDRFKGVGYSVGYLSNFFFQNPADGRGAIQRTDFLSVGMAFYRKNPDGRTTSYDRLRTSFSIGIPVYRSGNQFAKDAIRLSGTLYQKGFIKIQPEIYMNGFFKQVYPGLRVGFGL
ncbi:hypothetical protein [Fibrella aquatica]|uniref:hypothetical protein n=1 Tax=Fibrella aquatica TaxID=3242487 RepID=UPI003520FEE5